MAQSDKRNPATKPVKGSSSKLKSSIAQAEPPVTKGDRLRVRLEQADGASLQQLEQEFGWQPHTVRAAISGLRKAGLEVQRQTGDTSSVYRIVGSKVS